MAESLAVALTPKVSVPRTAISLSPACVSSTRFLLPRWKREATLSAEQAQASPAHTCTLVSGADFSQENKNHLYTMAAPTINYAKVAAMAPQPAPMQQHQMQQQQMPPRQPGQQGGDWKASAQIPAKDNRLKTTVRSPTLFCLAPSCSVKCCFCSNVAPDSCMDLSLAGCHSNQGEQF